MEDTQLIYVSFGHDTCALRARYTVVKEKPEAGILKPDAVSSKCLEGILCPPLFKEEVPEGRWSSRQKQCLT